MSKKTKRIENLLGKKKPRKNPKGEAMLKIWDKKIRRKELVPFGYEREDFPDIDPIDDDSVTVKKVVGCARCGKTHRNIRFAKLGNPVGRLTHWTPCPKTGEPILMRVIVDKSESEKEKKA